jgi:hypothetical protein
MQLTNAVGGAGGGEYRITCPIASFLIGFNARVGYWLDQLEPVCGLIDLDNPGNAAGSFHFKRVVDAMEPRVTGGTGGEYTDVSCPDSDEVVVALEVEVAHSDGHTYASNFFPICQRIRTPGDRSQGHGARWAHSGPTYEKVGVLSCPPGQWAVGVHGTSGIYIDSLGLVCDDAFRPGGVSQAPAPKPAGKIILSPVEMTGGAASAVLKALFHEFPAPLINGAGVDACLHWGTECGDAAANEFCKRQGYSQTSGYSYKVDSPPTLILGDNAICKDAGCDRFAAITCR